MEKVGCPRFWIEEIRDLSGDFSLKNVWKLVTKKQISNLGASIRLI
jgi:hypothetical protein